MRPSQRFLHSPRLTSTHPPSSDHDTPLTIPKMRERQSAKIREIADALPKVGLRTLDEQAKALGLLRSTAWNLLRGNHKSSGLSAGTINRILAAPKLPPSVRAIILQYVAEKSAGLYGDSNVRLRAFRAQLGFGTREHGADFGGGSREESTRRVHESNPTEGKSRIGRASHKK
jgi:hypothetical protein